MQAVCSAGRTGQDRSRKASIWEGALFAPGHSANVFDQYGMAKEKGCPRKLEARALDHFRGPQVNQQRQRSTKRRFYRGALPFFSMSSV